MTAVEKVLEICKEKNIRISKLERDLGFSNGYIKGLKGGKISAERVKKIADYLDVSCAEIDPAVFTSDTNYYLNDETAKLAQEIFDNKEMKALFDLARDATPEDIKTAYNVLAALKQKENG